MDCGPLMYEKTNVKSVKFIHKKSEKRVFLISLTLTYFSIKKTPMIIDKREPKYGIPKLCNIEPNTNGPTNKQKTANDLLLEAKIKTKKDVIGIK
jgi:hypothetical protein